MMYITDVKSARTELRKRLNIIQVVSDDLGAPAKETGNDKFWFCPFHSESKGASFGVHTQLQFYKCFGCQAGGDVVAWAQNFHSITVTEAINRLAATYHIDISAYHRPPTAEEIERARYQDICEEAAKYCTNALFANKQMLEWYIQDTGFDIDQIVTYDVGYCISTDQIIQHLHAKFPGISQDDIDKLEFTNRLAWSDALVYPIRDQNGRVARFYNKPLNPPPDFGGKYVGTSNRHPLFSHKLLFGFNVARKDLRKNGYVMRICEGQKAAIASGGVAVMGTQIHEEQIQLLREYGVKEVRVAFDGDNAGRAASVRLMDYINEFHDINVLITKMPEGKQPDGIVREFGKEALDTIFATAVLPVQFYVDMRRDAHGNLTTENKFSLVKDLKEHLIRLPDVQLDLTAEYLSRAIGVEPLSIKSYVVETKLGDTGLMNRDAEQVVLQHALLNQKSWSTIRQSITDNKVFTVGGHQYVYNAIEHVHRRAREDGLADSVTVQVVRDQLKIAYPQFPDLHKYIDMLLVAEAKYQFQDALHRIVDLYRRRMGIDQSRVLQATLGDLKKPTNDILSKYRREMVSSMEIRRDDKSNPISLMDCVRVDLEERMARKSAVVGFDFSTLRDVDGQMNVCLTGLTLGLSGLQKGHQVVISAYSGVGKSLLALQMATAISISPQPQDQIPTLWIPLEMNEIETSFRQISMLSGIDNTKLQAGLLNDEQYLKVKLAMERIASSQFYIKKPKIGSIDEIFAIVDEYHFKYGIQAVFVDYIQLVSPGPEDKGASREQVIGRASKVMKNQIAEGMGICSVCIAQQNRSNYVAGETGKIENIGGSYQIAQDADDVLLLQEKTPDQMAEAKDKGNRIAFLDKRRGGTSDIKFDLDLDTSRTTSLRWTECITPEQLMGLAKGLKV